MKEVNIVVIDDDKDLLEELKDIFNSGVYNVATFAKGETALNYVRNDPPDVILLDLKMKGKSGFQVARELKDNKKTKNIPIIAISAFYECENPPPLMKSHGFQELLTKPLNPKELIKTVNKTLEIDQVTQGGIQ